jgi:hypothetical protein
VVVSTLTRRLGRVAIISQRRQRATAPHYDSSDLTPWEQYELARLLDRVGSTFPHQARAQVPLTPDEQGRLEALVARMRVVEPGSR